ncbi:MAG: hypothetical protein AAB599_01945 [Patescibacteria group bacterium]
MSIPAFVDPKHTGVQVVVDVVRALYGHLSPAQFREFAVFMENPRASGK